VLAADARRVEANTVHEDTMTTVDTGTITRRRSRDLRVDRGVEWPSGRSTSVTMRSIFTRRGEAMQTPSAPVENFSYLSV